MSCDACDAAPVRGAFVRWRMANVDIIACREHWTQIRDTLVAVQAADREKLAARLFAAMQESIREDFRALGFPLASWEELSARLQANWRQVADVAIREVGGGG
jgi:hypothetical protein